MKITLLVVILLSVTAVSCTSTRTLTWDSPDPFGRLNEVAAKKEGVVLLASGAETRARALRAGRDSVSWIDTRTKTLVQVPVEDVAAVRFVRRGKGSLRGLGIGAAVGSAIGALISLGCDDIEDMDTAGCRFVVVTGLGVATGLLGSVFGAARGYEELFRFPSTPDSGSPEKRLPVVAHRNVEKLLE